MVRSAPEEAPVAAPQPESVEEERLDEALEETFPASDPPAATQHPHKPYWDQHRETD